MRDRTQWIGVLAAALFAACIPGEEGPGSGEACGSRGLGPCEGGEFCQFPESASCGEADAPGVCSVRPDVCTQQYAPVCGCDGKTYGNACTAAAAGVSVREQGECEDSGSGDFCGGLAGLPCDEGEYCSFAPGAQCGAADQTGVCRTKPQGCTKEFNPVCGCDDRTYSNACMAAAAGVSVLHEGECR